MQLFNLLFIYLRTYLKTYIMGQILPGVVVAFENPKGGVGKSTLTALFAGYIHSQSNEEGAYPLPWWISTTCRTLSENYVRTKPRTES